MAEELEFSLEDYKLLVADLTDKTNPATGKPFGFVPLHVPKKGYAIHQNKALFDSAVKAAEDVVGKNGFVIASVGTLGAYSQFFLSISISGNESFHIAGNDRHDLFFNLNSSHNGLIASHCMLSTVRIVCMNTVQMSISEAGERGTKAAIRHSKNSEALITSETFARNLSAWIKQAEAHKAFLEAARAVPMSLDGFRSFAAGVFTNEKSDALSTRSKNRIDELEILFVKGRGNKGESLYDAVNAFTEYFTHNGVGSENVAKNKRVASANFGRGNDWKLQAILSASNEDTLKTTMERGAVLYEDKLKADYAKMLAS